VKSARLLVLCGASVLAPSFNVSGGLASAQDMAMDTAKGPANPAAPKFYWGLSGIVLGTRESPAINNRTLTEGYLSQPMFMGSAVFPRYDLELDATINFEGLTIQRGELNAGMSGEGYIDRRHPHTYLHELVATWKHDVGADAAVSATTGKGFAPFGTDDPMMRPFVNIR
jgi:hypothetical protein